MPLDLEACLYLDFEARSEVDITEVGARAYAEHPSTELLCCGWVTGLQYPVRLWVPGEEFPHDAETHAYYWVAHNKDTERFLLLYKLGIVIPSSRWIDCATVTSAAGMPRNLHDVGASLKLEVQKQSKTPLLALSKPRKLSKKNSEKWWSRAERPDLYQQLYDYCRGDTDVMRKALAALPPYHWVMPAKEERLAVLTDKMNDLGVEVDLIGVDRASEVVEAHGARLRARFAELYPGVNPKHPLSVSKALGIDNARKETVRDELKRIEQGWTGYEADRHEALTVLKTIKTASTAKLKAFRRHACADGRVHGAMVFHGAGRTGRWSSMGVQLHNLVRGLGSGTPDWPAIDESPDAMDTFFDMLHAGLLDLAYKDPTRATAAAMKGFLLDTKDGLLSGDYSQIEARVLVDWAGRRTWSRHSVQKKTRTS
jgi:DNA polymerase